MNLHKITNKPYHKIFSVLIISTAIASLQMISQERTGGSAVYGSAFSKSQQLKIMLRSSRNDYRLDELIELEVSIQNISSRTYYIYNYLDWGESSSFSLWIKNVNTNEYVGGKAPSSLIPPPPTSKTSFTILPSGYMYGIVSKFSIRSLNISKPGKYIVEVTYHSPCSSRYSLGLPIWSKEMGDIKANTIEISVNY